MKSRLRVVLFALLAASGSCPAPGVAAAARPDLEAVSVTATRAAEGGAGFAARVRNAGASTTGRSILRVWRVPGRSGSGKSLVTSLRVRRLKAGATLRATGQITKEALGDATHLKVCVDATRRIRESSERNNCRTSELSDAWIDAGFTPLTPSDSSPTPRPTPAATPTPPPSPLPTPTATPTPSPSPTPSPTPTPTLAPTPTPTPTPSPAPTPTPSPAGRVVALLDPGEQSAPTYLAMAQVDAVAYRARWSDLEPTEGSLTTTHLDLVLSQAAAAGKPVTVHIGVSSGAAPSWLATKGIPTYSATTPRGTTTEYVPWDSTFLAAYSAFVTRLGQHLDGNATVNHVSVGAPVSEMTIVGCMNAMLGSTPHQRAAYLGAWRTTIDAVESAFPNVGAFVSLPLSFVCAGDGDGAAFAADLQSSLATTTSWFAADLRADGSVRASQLPPGATIGFQPTWYVTGDTTNKVGGSIQQMVCAGWNAGSRYFELYKQDLSSGSQDLTAALAAARTGSGC